MALVVVAAALALGCGGNDNTNPGGPRERPGYVIDSILPIEEHVRRFRVGLDSARALTGGAPSREALVRGLVRAIELRDTTALRTMMISRAEFAWLYYPHHEYARPPYELSPELYWFQITSNAEKGIGRALERLGGRSLGYRSHSCEAPAAMGVGRAFHNCRVTMAAEPGSGEGERALRLFGSIFELGGTFKFVSYANEF